MILFFQEQIAEHQQLAEHYRELAAKREALAVGLLTVQQQADSDLSSLKQLVDKCKEVAPSAIASLKSAVLNLFSDGGNNDGNDEPKQESVANPIARISAMPTEQAIEGVANDDTQIPEILSTGDRFWFGAVSNTGTVIEGLKADEYRCQIDGAVGEVGLERHRLHYTSTQLEGQHCDIDAAPLTGQHCQFTSHWEHDWELEPFDGQSWEIASPLCCLLSDVPQHNENKGTTEADGMAYIELVAHPENKAITYQRKHDGEIICAYIGFRTKAIAQSWMNFLEAITARVELRQAKRMQGFRWEMKVKGMSIQQIERLAKEAIDKAYRTEVNTAVPPTYKPRTIPQPVNPEEVGQGDIVTALLTPSASYKIIQVMPNGILDCENLTTGDRLGLRPGAVTLVQKAETEAVTDEPIVDPLTNILVVGDIVEVLEPPLKGQVGTVTQFNRYNELPLMVRCPGGEFGFRRQELKFISRPERQEPEVTVPSIFAASPYSKSFVGC
jgi:hypothetical protein